MPDQRKAHLLLNSNLDRNSGSLRTEPGSEREIDKELMLKPMDDSHSNVSIEEMRLREIHATICPLNG
jgi:hypothetical protein